MHLQRVNDLTLDTDILWQVREIKNMPFLPVHHTFFLHLFLLCIFSLMTPYQFTPILNLWPLHFQFNALRLINFHLIKSF